MGNRFMTRAVFGALTVAAMLLAGTAQAALQNRDLNGDGQTDAFYDTDLNITWLRDVNVAQQNWYQWVASAASFSFGSYSDWRLPGSDSCVVQHCVGSEMGHLWFIELGNSEGHPINTGGFQNLQFTPYESYWSGTDVGPQAYSYVFYANGNGLQFLQTKSAAVLAMLVRDGDVMAAIPEPETYALMLGGLAALALAIRQKRR